VDRKNKYWFGIVVWIGVCFYCFNTTLVLMEVDVCLVTSELMNDLRMCCLQVV